MTAPWDQRSAAEHARVERLLLASWLPAATSFSPYWADRVRHAGLEPESLVSRHDLERLDPVREQDIVTVGGAGAPALLMRPTEEQVKARATSSLLLRIAGAIRSRGEDGKRRALLEEYKPIHLHRGGADDELAVAYTRSDLDRLHRCGARAARVLGLDDADYLISAVPSGPRLDYWGVYHLALGASILAVHPRGHGDDLERTIASFALMPATVVAVPLDEAVDMAACLTDNGVEPTRVHTVVTVGPPPDAELRAQIEEAWRAAGAVGNVVARALFAPPEARALWAEPREEPTGLVTYPDLGTIEIVDPLTGRPSAGAGDLAITTTGWHGTALLRFQTGVYVGGIDPEPCPASGITTPRIVGEVVPRAWQPALAVAEGGVRHLDFRMLGAVLGTADGVRAWRVELRGPTSKVRNDRLLIEVGGNLGAAQQESLIARIAANSGITPTQLKVTADPLLVERRIAEQGSAFADAR